MTIKGKVLGLLLLGCLPLETPARAETVVRDDFGYRCFRDLVADGTVIGRQRTGVRPQDARDDFLCREYCERTAGCIGFNYMSMRDEAGGYSTWCLLLGAVTSTSPWPRTEIYGERREMCYRLAGPAGRGWPPGCTPGKPGCEFDTRGQTGPQRPPSAADDRPGRAPAPPGKK